VEEHGHPIFEEILRANVLKTVNDRKCLGGNLEKQNSSLNARIIIFTRLRKILPKLSLVFPGTAGRIQEGEEQLAESCEPLKTLSAAA